MKRYQRGYYNIDLGPPWLWIVIGIMALIGFGEVVWHIVAWLAAHIRWVND